MKRRVFFCSLRKVGTYPNGYVEETEERKIKISVFPVDKNGFSFELDKRTARLLAKRINQFLDSEP